MYKLIGSDGREYGPVNEATIRQWIAEGRLNGQSQIQSESLPGWKPLGSFPEFAGALAGPPPVSEAPPAFPVPVRPPTADDFAGRDYNLDIMGCISGGWELFKNNVGLLLVTVLIYMLIEGGVAILGAIPFIGPIFSILNILVVGPLLGGLYYVYIQTMRRQPATAGDVFIGFRKAFGQLLLGQLIPGLLAGLCLMPGILVAVAVMVPSMMQHHDPGVPQIVIAAGAVLVCFLPMIYLQINWMFALPLIIDQGMDFWPAMQASWRMVRKHWWQVFGLILLTGLMNALGFCCFCFGVLFTAPIAIGAIVLAYETMFRRDPAPAA
jgi:hypothetical protein